MSESQQGRFIESASGAAPAATKLLAHIREHYGTIPKFAEAHGLDRIKVQKAIHGKLTRIDVDFAVACFRATNGEVPVEDWILATAVDAPDCDAASDGSTGGAAA